MFLEVVIRVEEWVTAVSVEDIIRFIRDHHLRLAIAALMLLGCYVLGLYLMRSIRFVVTQFFRKPLDLQERYGRESWAVISGASDGIGRGFAVELARRGFHIVLMSRSIEKLRSAEAEVRHCNPNVKTKLIVADFRKSFEPSAFDAILCELEPLDVSVLVNNVGINHTESFATISEEFLRDIVAVNCMTQVLLTRKLIHKLLSRTGWTEGLELSTPMSPSSACQRKTKRLRSAVINVSSVAGQRPLLYLSPYSATKAFNDYFSRALSLEFPRHLDVLSLRPGYVVSNMSKLKEAGGLVLDRYECARGCLDKLGYVTETYGDPRHALYARSFFLIPESILALRRKQRLEEKNEAIAKESTTTTKKQD